jgi:phosphoenolpyruvate carboxykinase (GTP)
MRERNREMTAETIKSEDIKQDAPTTHPGILSWVSEIGELTQPDRVHWCTGSDDEWTELT